LQSFFIAIPYSLFPAQSGRRLQGGNLLKQRVDLFPQTDQQPLDPLVLL
jgi:hypothetical protein